MMGTNFYWQETDREQVCDHCHQTRPASKLHIGKSSAGWVFAVRVHPELGINTLDDWKRVWASGGVITDEYGDTLTVDAMLTRITVRSSDKWTADDDKRLRSNYAMRGPNNLYRSDPSMRTWGGSIRHGEGTWDYHEGEFS